MKIKFDGKPVPLKQIIWLDHPDHKNSYIWLRIAETEDLYLTPQLNYSLFKQCIESLQTVPCFSDRIGLYQEFHFGWVKGFYALSKVCLIAEMDRNLPVQEAVIKVRACLESWMRRGFDLNAPLAHQKCYPLHLATRVGSVALCTALLQLTKEKDHYKSQVNHKTALHIASEKGYAEVVETLLSYGAKSDAGMGDPMLRGITPLIAGIHHNRVVELLLRYGATKDARSEDLKFGPTALEKAARLGRHDVIASFSPVSFPDFLVASKKAFDRMIEVCSPDVQQQGTIHFWCQKVQSIFECLLVLDQLQRASEQERCASGSLTSPINVHLAGILTARQVEELCFAAACIIDEANRALEENQDVLRRMEVIYCYLLKMEMILNPNSFTMPTQTPAGEFKPE